MTKETLKQCGSLFKELRLLDAQIKELEQRRGGDDWSSLSELVYQSRMDRHRHIEETLKGVYETLNRLPSVERQLLEMRYLEDKSWQEIANKLNYSYDHVSWYLHEKALRLIEVKEP